MLNIVRFEFNPYAENTWLLWKDEGGCVVIDPSFSNPAEAERFYQTLKAKGVTPDAALFTHGHFDHIAGATDIQRKLGLTLYMNPADLQLREWNRLTAGVTGFPTPDQTFTTTDVADGQVLQFGTLRFEAIATPGHTAGGMCYYDREDGVLISGDTLFADAIGRSDLKSGDYDALIVSVMEKIMGLDGDTAVLPGHGRTTDIASERTHNPFLQPFNEPEEEIDPDAPAISINGR